jgi:opacity protein-like surface antigen
VMELSGGGGVALQANAGLGKVDSSSTQRNDYSLMDGYRINLRFTANSGDRTGHEFGYAYNRSQLAAYSSDGSSTQQGMAIHQGFYNYLLYPTREGSRIRPFATGGVHFNNYVPPGASAAQGGGSTEFGFNYGGGIKIRISEKFMIRFDARQYTNPKPFRLVDSGGWIRMNEISSSLAFVL